MVRIGKKQRVDPEYAPHKWKVVARKRELLRQKSDQDNAHLFTETYFDKTKHKGNVIRFAQHRTLLSYLKELLP